MSKENDCVQLEVQKTPYPITATLFSITDEMLIEAVKSKPELYDLASHLYSNVNIKRKTWGEVNRQLLKVDIFLNNTPLRCPLLSHGTLPLKTLHLWHRVI